MSDLSRIKSKILHEAILKLNFVKCCLYFLIISGFLSLLLINLLHFTAGTNTYVIHKIDFLWIIPTFIEILIAGKIIRIGKITILYRAFITVMVILQTMIVLFYELYGALFLFACIIIIWFPVLEYCINTLEIFEKQRKNALL